MPGGVVASYTPNPPVQGQPGSLIATVPAGETETVTFYSGNVAVGTVPIMGTPRRSMASLLRQGRMF